MPKNPDAQLAKLVTQFTDLLNETGPNAPAVERFIVDHAADHPEFVGLANVSRRLRATFDAKPPVPAGTAVKEVPAGMAAKE